MSRFSNGTRSRWARCSSASASAVGAGRPSTPRRVRYGAVRSGRMTRRLRRVGAPYLGAEAIADAVVRVHVGEAGAAVELLAELAHEHVDGAVAMAVRHIPDALVQLVAAEHAPGVAGQLVEQPELGAREPRVGRYA